MSSNPATESAAQATAVTDLERAAQVADERKQECNAQYDRFRGDGYERQRLIWFSSAEQCGIIASRIRALRPTNHEPTYDILAAAVHATARYIDNMGEAAFTDPKCRECMGRVYYPAGTPEPELCWAHQIERANKLVEGENQ